MRFGLMAGAAASSSDSTWEERFDGLLAWCREISSLGYGLLWWAGTDRGVDPQTALARLAAIDAGMDLAILYLVPLYHPVRLAAEVATWDRASGGRTTIAVAQGWRDRQFDAYGIPKEERLGRFTEALEAMKQLWQQDEVHFRGKYFSFDTHASGERADAATVVPRPVQQPYPRILVAANGDAAIRRAAAIADGWLISTRSTYSVIARQVKLFREAAEAAGRNPIIWAWRDAYCAKDWKTAIETVRPALEPFYADRARLGHDRDLPRGDSLTGSLEDIVRGRLIIGSPEDCAEEIEKYRMLGIENISMRMRWEGMTKEQGMDSVRLMASEVLSRFR
ncbi:MAG: LLM class flavin-dependent oxidoreductase [Betaproteobacteria bacterium]|nr:LLM class flavin-dependent oxidoreductase [Betaproteobacteria bacterium]